MDEEILTESTTPQPTIHSVSPENKVKTEIEELLHLYKEKRSVPNLHPLKAAESIQHLAKAVELLTLHASQELWNVFVKFFSDNKDGVCHYKNVLQGICSVPTEKQRMQTRFITFIMESLIRGGKTVVPQDKFFREIGKIDHPNDKIKAAALWNCYRRAKGIK